MNKLINKKIKALILMLVITLGPQILFASTVILPGDVSGLWNLAGSPYLVTGNILIPSDSTLTIESGVKVIFQTSNHYSWSVKGRLLAIGKPLQQIEIYAADSVVGFGGIRFSSLTASNDSSKLIYCSISHGIADAGNQNGGGIYIKNWSKVVIANCTIRHCRTVYGSGGGLYCFGSAPVISGNKFNANFSKIAGGGIYMESCTDAIISFNTFLNDSADRGAGFNATGGGISLVQVNNVTVSNNTFISNFANFGGGGIDVVGSSIISNNLFYGNHSATFGGAIKMGGPYNFNIVRDNELRNNFANATGGGIYCTGNFTIEGNTINENVCYGSAGGVFCEFVWKGLILNNEIKQNVCTGQYGGAIMIINKTNVAYPRLKIANNNISANSAQLRGGGIYYDESLDSLIITNNLISNNEVINSSTSLGGGVYLVGKSTTKISITNCTVANNKALLGGGIYIQDTLNPQVKNSIFWGNNAASGHEIYLNDDQSDPDFYACDIDGGSNGFGVNGNTFTGIYLNNLNTNPFFSTPAGGAGASYTGTYDWSLQFNSPCRNAGDTTAIEDTTDLLGNPRIFENIIDIGAIEFQTAVVIAKTSVSCYNGSNGTATASVLNGTPPYTFVWSDGQTTQTAIGLIAGNYSVSVTDNLGITASANVTITQPSPLQISGTAFPASCANGDGSAQVNVSGGTAPYYYAWSNGDSLANIAFLDSGDYAIQVTDTNGCVLHDSLTVFIDYSILPKAPTICLISVDSASVNNVIYWAKPTGASNIESYLIYRDIANYNYVLIGIVPFDSASKFVDTVRYLYSANGDPQSSSWRYKIAIKDVCGNISPKSPFHQTLFFQDNSGNFNWSEYKIEGEPTPVPQLTNYRFFRDNLGNGSWALIQSLSASSTLYTDVNYSNYPNGNWRVDALLSSNCNITQKALGLSTTRSNIKNKNAVSVHAIGKDAMVLISPNPAKYEIQIKSEKSIEWIKIYDASGRELLNQNQIVGNSKNQKIEIQKLIPGFYFVVCKGKDFEVRKKLLVSH